MSRRAPGAKRTPEGPGGRQSVRRAQGGQKGAEFRAATEVPSSLVAPTSQERASPRGQGALKRVWNGAGYAGALLRVKKEKGIFFAAAVI